MNYCIKSIMEKNAPETLTDQSLKHQKFQKLCLILIR